MKRHPARGLAAFLGVCSMFAAPDLVLAQTPAAKPQKLSASAIQIALVETGDVQIPPEFRFAIYERLVERMRSSGTFQKVFRSGDHDADGIPDLVTLHTTVAGFKEGSQTKRELTTVLGATKVDVNTVVTARDGHTLMDRKVTGRVRFFGENLGATNDLAKRISKAVHETF
jgi:hypothetical protein